MVLFYCFLHSYYRLGPWARVFDTPNTHSVIAALLITLSLPNSKWIYTYLSLRGRHTKNHRCMMTEKARYFILKNAIYAGKFLADVKMLSFIQLFELIR
jgi:hypothetical protein